MAQSGDERPQQEVRDRLLGLVPAARIRSFSAPSIPAAVVERFLALDDLTCPIADALDDLGVGGVCAAGLRPVRAGTRVCGPAVTLRYAPAVDDQDPVLGDRDLHGLASQGDVAVIDAGGDPDYAVLGELSVAWAMLAGEAGAVVDGAVRDLDALAAGELPVWSRAAAPRKALGRLDAVELNDAVRLAGVTVWPGDLVAGDDNGAVVVPQTAVTDVLERCERAQDRERSLRSTIAAAEDLPALVRSFRGPGSDDCNGDS